VPKPFSPDRGPVNRGLMNWVSRHVSSIAEPIHSFSAPGRFFDPSSEFPIARGGGEP
jgi:hypothetical protein